MQNKLLLFLLMLSLSRAIFALNENDFAFTAKIQTDATFPFYQLEIPTIVYEGINRVDLGDLRILNATGQVVPHGLQSLAAEKIKKEKIQSMPFFPLYQQQGQSINDLHLIIQRNTVGEVINISNNWAPEKSARLIGYLIDLREWKYPVNELKVSWKQTKNFSFIQKLRISSSQDLVKWQLLENNKTLVNLSFQNHKLIENSIKLSIDSAKYLRIMLDKQKSGLELDDIQVKHIQISKMQKYNWWSASVRTGNKSGEYLFQHRLKSVVNKLRLQLPENNTIVKIKVFSRSNNALNWQYRGSGLLYRLTVDGVNIQQKEISLSTSGDKYLKLSIDEQGGGLGSSLSNVKLGWQPQQLVFVARGQAPFSISWGSTVVKPVTVDASQLVMGVNKKFASGQLKDTRLIGQAKFLADSVRSVNIQALAPAAKDFNWRQWVIWIVLIAAAIMLIWMASGLMKKISTASQ